MANTDMFGRDPITQETPVTADKCMLLLDGNIVAEATQVSITYSQSVTRRRSIGGASAVIYGSMPQGQATIARMVISAAGQSVDSGGNNTDEFFAGDSWLSCNGGTIEFDLGDCGGDTGGGVTYSATGCIVTNYTIQAQAEDLTVVDNVTIEFLELTRE